jgi:hypothetical protein
VPWPKARLDALPDGLDAGAEASVAAAREDYAPAGKAEETVHA